MGGLRRCVFLRNIAVTRSVHSIKAWLDEALFELGSFSIDIPRRKSQQKNPWGLQHKGRAWIVFPTAAAAQAAAAVLSNSEVQDRQLQVDVVPVPSHLNADNSLYSASCSPFGSKASIKEGNLEGAAPGVAVGPASAPSRRRQALKKQQQRLHDSLYQLLDALQLPTWLELDPGVLAGLEVWPAASHDLWHGAIHDTCDPCFNISSEPKLLSKSMRSRDSNASKTVSSLDCTKQDDKQDDKGDAELIKQDANGGQVTEECSSKAGAWEIVNGQIEAQTAITPMGSTAASIQPADVVEPQQQSEGWSVRARRKRLQVESFFTVLQALLSHVDSHNHEATPLHVVDFGCGSGNLLLPLAWLLRDKGNIFFTGVDMNPTALHILQQRAQQARLRNVSTRKCMIHQYTGRVDVALALHACGNATDHALLQARKHRAAFIVSPCCVGKLKFSMEGGSSFSSRYHTWTPRGTSLLPIYDEQALRPATHQLQLAHEAHAAHPAFHHSTASISAASQRSRSSSHALINVPLATVLQEPVTELAAVRQAQTPAQAVGVHENSRQDHQPGVACSSSSSTADGSTIKPNASSTAYSSTAKATASSSMADDSSTKANASSSTADGSSTKVNATSSISDACSIEAGAGAVIAGHCARTATITLEPTFPSADDNPADLDACTGHAVQNGDGVSSGDASGTASGGWVLQHPQSGWLRCCLPEPDSSFKHIAQVADAFQASQGVADLTSTQRSHALTRLCKVVVEADRLQAMHEAGYHVALRRVKDSLDMPKPDLLIGVPSESQSWNVCINALKLQ